MMTLTDIAMELKVSRRTIYRWIKSGKLKALKFEGIYRVKEEEFTTFLEKAEKGASTDEGLRNQNPGGKQNGTQIPE